VAQAGGQVRSKQSNIHDYTHIIYMFKYTCIHIWKWFYIYISTLECKAEAAAIASWCVVGLWLNCL
jgi:hypothetical protein